MPVNRDYMLKKSSGPSGPKVFLDQVVVPGLVNGVGAVEGGVERLAAAARRNPLLAVGLVAGAGLVLATWRGRRAA